MGSNSFLGKSKAVGYRTKSGSSAGSDKDMNGRLRRPKLRKPIKINEYGLKKIPDYTELAYKEAVSKLRYFLSGNYAPSSHSYGSPSIRNLEESDGEAERRYSPSYALAEIKPRPKLTAKYATLYADSLLNAYTPNAPATTTSAHAEVPGAANPDVVNFIQKQEEYIEQLERESQYCRDELNTLLGKVKEVISENEHLHEAQKNKLISRMFHSYNAGSETDDLDDFGDSTGLDSENKVSRARKSAKLFSSKLDGPNIVFESRISELEAQLAQSKIDLKKIQDENNDNKRKLASGLVDSTCLDGFKRQIDNLQRDKNALEAQISKLKLSLDQRDGEDKYRRGTDIAEAQLREERNNLEIEILRLKDDLAKERSKIRDLAGEGARRAIQERNAAEQRYNTHFDELQHDLVAQYDNVSKLQLELERQRREENDLKRELSMKNSAIEELKMELKNKTSTLQADLAQAYAEKASLEEELASTRLAIERHQRQAKHDANRLNSEIQSLRQRLDRADADLVHSRRENLRLSEQIATLEKEINMKNLTPSTPPEKKKERELSTMLESMDEKHTKTVAELESMIQSQNSLMEKLTGECRLLTDKLDDASRRHKAERTHLLCRNAELMRKLRNLWSSHKKYCTTAMAPLRSYTPLSGYPHSRSSYDCERTYFSSTPYTCNNTLTFKKIDYASVGDIDDLTKHLSDLLININCDSDDEQAKIMWIRKLDHLYKTPSPKAQGEIILAFGNEIITVIREELAALHRQVNCLGKSLQPLQLAPNTYQAPTTNSTSAIRAIPASSTEPRPDYTGADTPTHAQVRRPSLAGFQPHRDNRPDSKSMSRQSSIQSIKTSPINQYSDINATKKGEDYRNIVEDNPYTGSTNQYNTQEYSQENSKDYEADQTPVEEPYDRADGGDTRYEQYQGTNQENRIVYENRQGDNAQYEQDQGQYEQQTTSNINIHPEMTGKSQFELRDGTVYETTDGNQQYEQDTANVPYELSNSAAYQTNVDYQNRYDEQHDAENNYAQGQYENYDQYADPNAQYEYPVSADGQYQGNQYVDTQYQQHAQEYQQPETLPSQSGAEKPKAEVGRTESKRSNSPNDKAKS